MSTPPSHASWLSTATALFFAWALMTLPVRVWVKLGRKSNWGLDDSAIVAAFAATLIHIAMIFWAISHDYGRSLDKISSANRETVETALFTAQIFYIIAVGLSKVSTAFFIGRLTRYAPQIRLSYILAAMSGVFIIAGILVITLRGDLSHPWTTLDGSEALFVRWIAVEAVGLVIEAAIWVLSINLVWGLHMKLEKRILILSAFGCRLILVPLVAIRLYYLCPARNSDPTYTSILSGILTEAALEYSLLSASVTSLKPFLRPLHSGAIVNTVGGNESSLHSGLRSNTQAPYMLSQISNNDKIRSFNKVKESRDPSQQSQNRDRDYLGPQNAQNLFRPNKFEQQTVVSARGDHSNRDEMESVESVGSDQMIIRTTKDWSVRYEEE